MAPDSSPSTDTRIRCAISRRCNSASDSAVFRSVRSMKTPLTLSGMLRCSPLERVRARIQRVSPPGCTMRKSRTAVALPSDGAVNIAPTILRSSG